MGKSSPIPSMLIQSRNIMLEAIRRKTCQNWKPERAVLARKEKEKKRFKVKTRKGSLNLQKIWNKNNKRKWEVKLKTRKGGWTTKRRPRSKTWKSDLGRRKLIKGIQGMESCDNQASLVCGKVEFDICSEMTKDIAKELIWDRIYGLLT